MRRNPPRSEGTSGFSKREPPICRHFRASARTGVEAWTIWVCPATMSRWPSDLSRSMSCSSARPAGTCSSSSPCGRPTPASPRLWVTFDKSDARSLLRDEDVVYAYGPTNRTFGLDGSAEHASQRRARVAGRRTHEASGRPDDRRRRRRAVRMGRPLRGARVVYVESFTRIDGPVTLLRLIRPVAARVYGQWPEFAQAVPRAALPRQRVLPRMILVTVGTNEAPFDRLVGVFDAPSGADAAEPGEEVLVQHGASLLRPAGATCVDFLPFDGPRRRDPACAPRRHARRRRLDHDRPRERKAAGRRPAPAPPRRGGRRSSARSRPPSAGDRPRDAGRGSCRTSPQRSRRRRRSRSTISGRARSSSPSSGISSGSGAGRARARRFARSDPPPARAAAHPRARPTHGRRTPSRRPRRSRARSRFRASPRSRVSTSDRIRQRESNGRWRRVMPTARPSLMPVRRASAGSAAFSLPPARSASSVVGRSVRQSSQRAREYAATISPPTRAFSRGVRPRLSQSEVIAASRRARARALRPRLRRRARWPWAEPRARGSARLRQCACRRRGARRGAQVSGGRR